MPGDFAGALINFIIIALVIFLLVRVHHEGRCIEQNVIVPKNGINPSIFSDNLWRILRNFRGHIPCMETQ